jgi:hypothetical protein
MTVGAVDKRAITFAPLSTPPTNNKWAVKPIAKKRKAIYPVGF